MDHFAGLDVSVKERSVCIVDEAGKIVRVVRTAAVARSFDGRDRLSSPGRCGV
jgi:hypothetical protein